MFLWTISFPWWQTLLHDLAFQSFDWAYLMYAISDTRHEQCILHVSKLFTFIYSRANSVIIKQKKPTIILNLIHNILLQRQLPHNVFGPVLLKVSNNISCLVWIMKIYSVDVFFLLCLSSFCVLCQMLSVSLDCPFLIDPFVLSNVYLHTIQALMYKAYTFI
jgi:hypothetical protein